MTIAHAGHAAYAVVDSARHGDLSRADHLHDADRAQEFDHALDLVLSAGDLNDD